MSFSPTAVLQPPGITDEEVLSSSELRSSPKFDIRWANAESRIAELLSLIQPSLLSELQRKAVADYVSGLIHKSLGCEVFKFGSVPLKTYLPDGDIDLTAFSHYRELRDTWASDVQTVLEHEEQRKDAECRVSKVQCINAEVKLVKCVVEDIVVDISFNQLGGLCTLCFLEEVDRLIQKDHLFKRSILLVKAWCYYESRILGAHHGLISTYALETLVLYIFNIFHANLRGPLEVLFIFLDYFSKFDWERYCISLWGPVPLASLPNLTAESPLKSGGKLLLSKAFLESCSAMYDVFPKGQDSQARTFGGKFFNIVDPLRTNNNLGRSVSQANFYRIRNAFHRGAHEVAKLFDVDDVDFPKCLDKLFSNTWERHQNRYRLDAPTSAFQAQADILYTTTHSSDQANDVLGRMLSTEKWAIPSREKLIMDEKAVSPHSPSSSIYIRRDGNTEAAGQQLDMKVFAHGFNSSKGLLESPAVDKTQMLSSPAGEIYNPVFTTQECPNTQLTLVNGFPFATNNLDSHSKTRTVSSDSSTSSKRRPEFPAALRRAVSEGRIERNLDAVTAMNCCLPEDVQAINVWQTTSQHDHNEVWKSVRSPLETEHVEGMPKISSGYSNLKRSGSCRSQLALDSNAAPQKPPGFLFPESRDLLYTPSAAPPSLPSFPSSSISSGLSPSHVSDPIYSPGLDVQKTTPAQVNTTAVSLASSIEVSEMPPPPWLPSYEEVQRVAKATPPLLNGMNASQTRIPHSRTRAATLSHAEDLAETMKSDDKMQPSYHPQRQEFLHAKVLSEKKGDSYGGPEGFGHAFSAPPLEVKANIGSDFLDKSGKRASGSSDSDGHNLPGYAPYFGQPFSTHEATMPSLEQVVHPVDVDSSVAHSFGTSMATGSLAQEGGGNQVAEEGVPNLYIPMGVFPAVSYYNPFYSSLPVSPGPHFLYGDKTGGLVGSASEESTSQAFHGSAQKLKSTTSAAKFAPLSAGGGGRKEPSRDLLRSDLANHLQNLQFGRWCQEEQVLQPYLESPSPHHTSEVPVLWGVSPFTAIPGMTGPFSHEFGDIKGPIPVPFLPQNFNSMPQNLPWPGTTVESIHKQKIGTEMSVPLSNAAYRETESSSLQTATQFDQRTSPREKQQGGTDTWRMTHGSTMSYPSGIHASTTPPSNFGACNGFGTAISDHSVRSVRLPDQLPGRAFPLVTGQLEFGSLGPIEIISFSDSEVGTRQLNKYSMGDTNSPPLLARDTVPNIPK